MKSCVYDMTTDWEYRACGRFGAPSNASIISENRSEMVLSPVFEGAPLIYAGRNFSACPGFGRSIYKMPKSEERKEKGKVYVCVCVRVCASNDVCLRFFTWRMHV